MKTFLKFKLWPVVAGLLSAFIIMMFFEYINSLIYPLPQGLDIYDNNAVKEFTSSLPWTAYILVFIGFVLGSFKAGCVTTYLSKEKVYKLSFIVGIILTLFAVLNAVLIGHSILFNIISLFAYVYFIYLYRS